MAFEAISNTTYASRTNTVIPAAGLGTITDGDYLLLLFAGGATTEAPDPTPPAGFVLAPGAWPVDVSDTAGFNMEYRVYEKWASAESGDYTVTHATASSQGAILRFSGRKSSAAINPTPTIGSQTSGGTLEDSTVAGLTTLVDNCDVVLHGFSWGQTTNDLTPPAGTPTFTERLDTTIMYIATGVMTTAGPTGDKTMANNSSSTQPWVLSLIAIEPAPTGATFVRTGIGIIGP